MLKGTGMAAPGDSRREWNRRAVAAIDADATRSADTHLIRIDRDHPSGVALYAKDESSHPTGSLKHRLARSLFLYGLCNDWIGPHTVLIDATSGSTAVSEAYFARLLGLRFVAVMARSVSAAKVDAVRFQGGDVHFVDNPADVYAAAEALERETGGHYLDQFTYAERATDWRGNNNVAQSIFAQLAREPHPIPTWLVCGAGTGGTSATLGRYIRYGRHATRLCVADPAGSVFHRHYADRSIASLPEGCISVIEGIGRPRVEPSFVPDVIDRMIPVTDAASIGAARALSDHLDRPVGGSTGTNLVACRALAREMRDAGVAGSIVTLLCDSGHRYADTLFADAWLDARAIEWRPHHAAMLAFLEGGAA